MLKKAVLFWSMSFAMANLAGRLKVSSWEEEWNEEVAYWGSVVCHAGRSRLLSLYEVPETDPSGRNLYDFYRGINYYVQTECGMSTKTKSYLNANRTVNLSSLIEDRANEEIISNTIVDIENMTADGSDNGNQTRLFPRRDVEILVMLIDDSASLLSVDKIFNEWDNRRFVIVVMLTREPNVTYSPKTNNFIAKSFTILLHRLWSELQILNVYFVAPFSNLGHLVWLYDPFTIVDKKTKKLTRNSPRPNKRGKIIARRLSSLPLIDRIADLHGYELNIGMFDARPAAIQIYPDGDNSSSQSYPFARESYKFVGIDGMAMEMIAELMNFSPKIVPPTGGIEFGYVHPNGTFFGTIGDVVYHRIDISFNSMYMKMYSQDKFCVKALEFSTPIDFDRLCIIAPRAKKIPRWLRTFHSFHPAIWLSLIATHLIVTIVRYLVKKIRSNKSNKSNKVSLGGLLVETFFLFIGIPVKFRVTQLERFVVGGYLVFGVTMMGTYTGTLYHSFTTEMYYKEIESLKELDEYGIPIGTGSPNLGDIFGLEEADDDPEEIKSLRKKFIVNNRTDIPTIERTARYRDVASLSREHSFFVSDNKYVDDTGASVLHLIPDCPRAYYLSFVSVKNSIYIPRLNKLLRRLLEAGLPPLWNSAMIDRFTQIQRRSAKKSYITSKRVPFNLCDLQTAFLILLIGHAAALLIFIAEIIYKRKLESSKDNLHRTPVRKEIIRIRNTLRSQ